MDMDETHGNRSLVPQISAKVQDVDEFDVQETEMIERVRNLLRRSVVHEQYRNGHPRVTDARSSSGSSSPMVSQSWNVGITMVTRSTRESFMVFSEYLE